ncbi:MAG: AAA domain-containing protein [Promethearchaeota archaeon]
MSKEECQNGKLNGKYLFEKIKDKEVSFKEPFICKVISIVDENKENDYCTVIVEDEAGKRILGFIYKKFYKIIIKPEVRRRLPFLITIVYGKLKSLSGALVFEIYQVVFEKDTLINSSAVGLHSYCPAQTYINMHIMAETDLNINLLYGVLLHDYLSIIFEDRNLFQLNLEDKELSQKVKTAYLRAIYRNWRLLAAFGVSEEKIFSLFMKLIFRNELEFLKYEIGRLKETGNDYLFETEKMLRSFYFGLKGRIDRLLRNRTKNKVSLYETKTGKSSAASIETAQNQLISYYMILNEYFNEELEELILEYPRLPVKERLKVLDFNTEQFSKILLVRNEIWSIAVGVRPEYGPFLHCGNCWSKNICSFYCLRSYLGTFCQNCERCKYNSLIKSAKSFEEFRRINVYYDWFSSYLDAEYLANLSMLSELSLSAQERESLGNAIADLKIESINYKSLEAQIPDQTVEPNNQLEDLDINLIAIEHTTITNENTHNIESTNIPKEPPISNDSAIIAELNQLTVATEQTEDKSIGLSITEINSDIATTESKERIEIILRKSHYPPCTNDKSEKNDSEKNFKNSVFAGTRLNRGDFILLTSQEFQPLTYESFPCVIKTIENDRVVIELNKQFLNKLLEYHADSLFRIDAIVSNDILNVEKSALDLILRKAYNLNNSSIRYLRKILINLDVPNLFPEKLQENQETNIKETLLDKEKQDNKKTDIVIEDCIDIDNIKNESFKNLPTDPNFFKGLIFKPSEIQKIRANLKNKGYNYDQIEAIIKSIRTRDIILIQGPPGTGKTTITCEIINILNQHLDKQYPDRYITENLEDNESINQLKNKNDNANSSNTNINEQEIVEDFTIPIRKTRKKILVCAYTNRAVDNIAEKLIKEFPKLKIIRIGQPSSISPNVESVSLLALSKIKKNIAGVEEEFISPQLVRQNLDSADIILSTCIGAGNILLKNFQFDFLLIDEAGQLIEPAALIPISKSSKIIMIGDDMQLPPISQKIIEIKFDDEFFKSKPYLVHFSDLNLNGNYITADSTLVERRKKIFFEELQKMGIYPSDSLTTSVFQRLKRIYGFQLSQKSPLNASSSTTIQKKRSKKNIERKHSDADSAPDNLDKFSKLYKSKINAIESDSNGASNSNNESNIINNNNVLIDSNRFHILKYQYRMNQIINNFISENFYGNLIKPGSINGKNIGTKTLNDFIAQTFLKLIGNIEPSKVINAIISSPPIFSNKNTTNTNINNPFLNIFFQIISKNDSNYSNYCNNLLSLLKNSYGRIINPSNPVIFIDYSHFNAYDSKLQVQFQDISSKFNYFEADIIALFAIGFIINTIGLLIHLSLNPPSNNLDIDIISIFKTIVSNIGIITPYRAQVRLIREKIFSFFNDFFKFISSKDFKQQLYLMRFILHNNQINQLQLDQLDQLQTKNLSKIQNTAKILTSQLLPLIVQDLIIDTVDKFQGREAEIIIISMVDSNPDKKFGELHNDLRRFNVSLTRAKSKLIVIANGNMVNINQFIDNNGKLIKQTSTISKSKKKPLTLLDYIQKNPKQSKKEKSSKQPIAEILKKFIIYAQKNSGFIKLMI